MTNNTSFPSPPVPIKNIQTALTAYTDALHKSYEGTKIDTTNKNLKRAELEALLSNLGNYVNTAANSDLLKLESSGFPISKIPEAVGVLPPPEYLNVTDSGVKGQLNIEIAKVDKAHDYIVIYSEIPAPDDHSLWQAKLFTKPKGSISGLKSVTKYVFKAAASSSDSSKLDEYKFSAPVERVTQ